MANWEYTCIQLGEKLSSAKLMLILPIYIIHLLNIDKRADGNPAVDPGFQERAFMCIKGWGVRFADFIRLFLNIP